MNNSFVVSTINETEKLWSRKKYWVLPILALFLTLAAVWGLVTLENAAGIMPVRVDQFPILILGWFAGLILPLFIVMAAADLFSGELGERTLKQALLQPVTRLKLYLAKLTALGGYIVVSLIFILFVSLIASLFLGTDIHLGSTLAAYAASILPMLVIGIAAICAAQFFKNGSGVLVFSILIFIASKVLVLIFPAFENASLSTFTGWYLFWIGNTVNTGKMISIFMFMLSYSIILVTSGYLLFERREL